MADADTQRLNMVESQVRPSDVTDRRIIRAMLAVPRHRYVQEGRRAIAYVDGPVPLTVDAQGRSVRELMAPRVFAKLLQVAMIPDDASVLIGGSGAGYGAAVIARFAKVVVGVEPDPGLAEGSRATLATEGVSNATIVTAQIADGSNVHAPFDVIVLEGAIGTIPMTLLDQLKDGGRLVAIRMDGRVGKAVVTTRSGGTCDERAVFDAVAPLLPGAFRKAEFAF